MACQAAKFRRGAAGPLDRPLPARLRLAMDLWKFRQEHGLSLAEMARRIGVVSAATVWRYELAADHPAARIPGRWQMMAIYRATDGAVTPNDFYDLNPAAGNRPHERQEPAAPAGGRP